MPRTDCTEALWQEKFELLRAFHRENGHCRIPTDLVIDSVQLGQWVYKQRLFYKNRMEGRKGRQASITDERIAQLNTLGFDWMRQSSAYDAMWQEKFELLRAFHRENGHCRVPKNFVIDSVKLGQWVRQQRINYNKRMGGEEGSRASINDERIAQLNTLGFDWMRRRSSADALRRRSSADALWQKKFELLRAFHRENGHCRVPTDLVVDSVKLGKWVENQRSLYKHRTEEKTGADTPPISDERIAQLNTIGFDWTLISKSTFPSKLTEVDHDDDAQPNKCHGRVDVVIHNGPAQGNDNQETSQPISGGKKKLKTADHRNLVVASQPKHFTLTGESFVSRNQPSESVSATTCQAINDGHNRTSNDMDSQRTLAELLNSTEFYAFLRSCGYEVDDQGRVFR